MRPNEKTGGLTLESYPEQRVVSVGAKMLKDYGLIHHIRAYGQSPPGEIDSRLPRVYPITNPVTGYIHHPSLYGLQPVAQSTSPELEIPSNLINPTLFALYAVANMSPLRAYFKEVDPAHALRMLETHWQHTFNEDSPQFI